MKTYCTSYSKRRGSLISRPSTTNDLKGNKKSTSQDYISIDQDMEADEASRRQKMKEKLAQYGRIEIMVNKG